MSKERLAALAADRRFLRRLVHRVRGPRRLPGQPPLVPGPERPARRHRLLLTRVRHHLGAAAVQRRPRHPRRGPPQGRQRPRRAADRRRAALPARLLPAEPVPRGLAAGALPGPRPQLAARHPAARGRRHPGRGRPRSSPAAAPSPPGSGRPRSAGSRCCCSTPTSRATSPPSATSPTGSTAAAASTGCSRRCCWASAGCGPYAPTAGSPATPPPRSSTPTRATPASSAWSASESCPTTASTSTRPWRPSAPGPCSPPTPPSPPASTASTATWSARHLGDGGELPGVDVGRILELGLETHRGGDPNLFNMAVMGMRLAQRANGVSTLHGAVSREMFAALWPGLRPRRRADHLHHQRGARAHLGRPRGAAAGRPPVRRPARRGRPDDRRRRPLGGGRRHPGQRRLGAAPHPARTARGGRTPPAARLLAAARGRRRRTRLDRSGARPRRPHHRLRPPGPVLQAAHPDAARQGAARRPAAATPTGRSRSWWRARRTPPTTAASAWCRSWSGSPTTPGSGTASSSCPTTTCGWPGCSTPAATSGSTTRCARWRRAAPPG